MPSPILARADALMQRRHLSTADTEEVPVLTDAIDAEEEIPVLLDIATPPLTAAPPRLPEPVEARLDQSEVPAIDADWGAALVEELGRRIEQRLLAEIPKIVAASVAELLDEQQATKQQFPD